MTLLFTVTCEPSNLQKNCGGPLQDRWSSIKSRRLGFVLSSCSLYKKDSLPLFVYHVWMHQYHSQLSSVTLIFLILFHVWNHRSTAPRVFHCTSFTTNTYNNKQYGPLKKIICMEEISLVWTRWLMDQCNTNNKLDPYTTKIMLNMILALSFCYFFNKNRRDGSIEDQRTP